MFWNTTETRIKQTVEILFRRVLDDAETTLGKIKTVSDLTDKIKGLQTDLETLKIEKDRKDEEYSRKDREIEHKIGLERTRQEFEVAQAKREATLEVEQKNLDADKDRFKSEMEFQRKRLEKEVDSLNGLVKQLLKRVPSVEVLMEK